MAITDEVRADVQAWHHPALERMPPVMTIGATKESIRDESTVWSEAVCLRLGVDREGCAEMLGRSAEQVKSAGFRRRIVTELRSRGVEDGLVSLVAGPTGLPDGIMTVILQAQAQVHHCLVYFERHSIVCASWRDRKITRGDSLVPEAGRGNHGVRRLRRGPVGHQVTRLAPDVAAPPAAGTAGLRLCTRAPPAAVHTGGDRGPAGAAPEVLEDAPLPDRRSGGEVVVSCAGERG